MAISRKPPITVVRQLRKEVGFRCPVAECGNPYLTWHHFDPPWRDEEHHRPQGMIALCLDHARRADGGAFTNDQLRTLKAEGASRAAAIQGHFDWMRRELLAVIGGSFYYRTPVILQLGNRPAVWFNRDDEGYLLLNFWMPTASGEERARILDNWWVVPPDVDDLECPPTGRRIHVHYPNGDDLRVEFFDIPSADDLRRRYPEAEVLERVDTVTFPITGVELWETATGMPIELGPKVTRIGGIQIVGGWMEAGRVAIQLGLEPGVGGRAFHDEDVTLTDLVSADNPVLEQMRFDRCRILGPTVLVPAGGTQLLYSNMGGPLDAILWPRADPRFPISGAVVANGCVFDHCEFIGVGFALPPDQIAQLRGEIEGLAPPAPG
jgi:hypothetical protein